MIELSQVRAIAHSERLLGVSAAFESGLHTLVADRRGSLRLLRDLVTGDLVPRSGHVSLFGASPGRARREVARVDLEDRDASGITAAELVELAASARDESGRVASGADRLRNAGVGSLAPRLWQNLSSAERRAVLFVEAESSLSVRVVLIDEPSSELTSALGTDACARIRALSLRPGVCVLAFTSSYRSARELGGRVWQLSMDQLSRVSGLSLLDGEGPARAVLVVSHPREFLSRLKSEPEVSGVEAYGHFITLFGDDPRALSDVVARVSVAGEIDIHRLTLHGRSRPSEEGTGTS